jgi:hypothetical protein
MIIMRERGITFNAEMVRAVLEGRKTQTRRIMKVQPESNQYGLLRIIDSTKRSNVGKCHWAESNATGPHTRSKLFSCPFGAVGDRLWVRETWMPDAPRDGTWGDVEFYGCKGSPLSMIPKRYRKPEHCIHRASWDCNEMVGWTPSIHMPRWASRITLEITGVRVERLQNISQADAVAEGIKSGRCGNETSWRDAFYVPGDNQPYFNAETAYGDLWSSIYGDESWQANPWVWVIEFKRVEATHD